MRRLSTNQEPELLSAEELQAVIGAVEKDGKRVGEGYGLDGSAPPTLSSPADWGLIPYITEDRLRRPKNPRLDMAPEAKNNRSRETTHNWDWITRRAYHPIRAGGGKPFTAQLLSDAVIYRNLNHKRTDKTLRAITRSTKVEYTYEQRRDAQKPAK